MTKKFLLVTVGGVRDVVLDKNENGEVASLETIDNIIQLNNASVMDVIRHNIQNHVSSGLETEQLDSAGHGTGLGKNLLEEVQKITNMIEADSIKELKSTIHSEIKDDHTAIAVLGNDISVNKEDQKIIDELTDEGVVIYTSDETEKVAGELCDACNETSPAETAVSKSGMDEGEPEIDLGALVGEPGKKMSEETEEKQKEALGENQ